MDEKRKERLIKKYERTVEEPAKKGPGHGPRGGRGPGGMAYAMRKAQKCKTDDKTPIFLFRKRENEIIFCSLMCDFKRDCDFGRFLFIKTNYQYLYCT